MSVFSSSWTFWGLACYISPILRASLDSSLDLVTKSSNWRRGVLLDLVSTKRLPPRLSVSELHRWQVKTNLYILPEVYWGRLAAWQSAVCSALCCNTLPPSCMTPAQIPRTGLLYSRCDLIQCENTNNSQKSHQQMLRFYVWHTDKKKTITKRFESETQVKNQRGSLFVLWQSKSLLDFFFFLLFWLSLYFPTVKIR